MTTGGFAIRRRPIYYARETGTIMRNRLPSSVGCAHNEVSRSTQWAVGVGRGGCVYHECGEAAQSV